MARAINVILEIGGDKYNLSDMGLVSMTFDRYLSAPNISKKHFLINMDITMFDSTGYKLLSILQGQNNKLRVKYGFSDALSEVYNLNLVKFRSTYNNMGVMVAVGAVGNQINRRFGAEKFLPETKVDTILRMFAKRNGWYIGPEVSNEFIDVGNLRLDRVLFKTDKESDIEFVNNKLLKACDRIITTDTNNRILSIWDVGLAQKGERTEFYFRKSSQRTHPRRVWTYSYGADTNNNIISLTNTVDQTFLINGLTIQVPMLATDYLIDEEGAQEEIESILESNLDAIQELIERYGLPMISPRDFAWNIEIVAAEDTGTDINYKDMVLDRIKQVMLVLNTVEMEVIGNPKISQLDLIDLRVINRGEDNEGRVNIISSDSSKGSYWRVIGIQETIGLEGYTTKLSLVRDHPQLVFEKPKTGGGGGIRQIEEA